MNRYGLLVLAAVLAGCAAPKVATQSPEAYITPAAKPAKSGLAEPNFTLTSRLAVLKAPGKVQVGDERAAALRVFAPPTGSYEHDDLPPSIPEPYSARGWQTDDEGIGLILFEGKVAAVVHEMYRAPEDRCNEIVEAHRAEFGAPSSEVANGNVRYLFWDDNQAAQRLMLCTFEQSPKKFNLTVALGTNRLMDALGMAPDYATGEQRLMADIERAKPAKGPKSSN